MRLRFPFRLALWEGRSSLRGIGLYMLSISLGVGSLVAVHSFRDDVSRSIRAEAQVLMGADFRLWSTRPLPDSVSAVLDSLESAGVANSTVTTAVSMAAAVSSDGIRLVQVRAVEGGWPFYGQPAAGPADAWTRSREADELLAEPAALTQLGVSVGDSLTIGNARFVIVGTVEDLPTELGFQTAIGPMVYVTPAGIEAAGILGFGSLARYDTYVVLPDIGQQAAVEQRYEETFRATGTGFGTARERARDMTEAVEFLGQFLGLIGLGALLLGGIGVGSAIHVFVKERLTQVAVLRCIGARQGSVFLAYLLQAAALGLMGSIFGAFGGVAVQQVLPTALAGVLPVAVSPEVSWTTIAAGIGVGVWVATIFALLPLLQIRDVPPLRALRQDVDPTRRKVGVFRTLAMLALTLSVVALSVLEAPEPRMGFGFAAGLAGATLLLWMAGLGMIGLTRRMVPKRAPWVVRQGYSNLFRPGNQTVAVTLAMGFGAFVVGTVLQVQGTLGDELSFEMDGARPNLLLFDVQSDQTDGVMALLPVDAQDDAELTPMINARILALNGIGRDSLAALDGDDRPAGWATRRQYRHTYRDQLTDAETLVDGGWWDDTDAVEGAARISIEVDLAEDLGVGLGDRITWEIGGIPVESVITSTRTVDWGQFRTNFFVVFEPGTLDDAPANWVVLGRVEEAAARGAFQRDLIQAFPNVSVLDVSRVQEALGNILDRVDQAIRFLAGFAAVAGLLVLAGALASSRQQRQREGALLKTLGARRKQVLSVLFSEYLALGLLAGLTGLALSLIASWLLIRFVFQLNFSADLVTSGAILLALGILTVVTGLIGSRDLLRKPPLAVLRGE